MRTVILTLALLFCLSACGDPVVPVCGGPPVNPAPRGGAVSTQQPDMGAPDLAPMDMQPDAR